MIQASIYARRSTEQRGVDDEAKSVALQIQSALAFAAEQHWTVDPAHIYSDEAVSGAETRKLRGRQRLLETIARGAPFQKLIVREESRFSRRDGDEALAELKRIARAGVEIHFYRSRTQFTYGNLGDNVSTFVKAEAAADYWRQISGWTYDAMLRRARLGHVAGGQTFGYTNQRVDGHVERHINPDEAAVIREIFARAAAGAGLKAIAKALNAASAVAPRSKARHVRGWSHTGVREVLHRDLYRGLIV